MDMQTYLSKLDALKASYATLMPYAKDATAHSEQQSKFFMVMALKGLPPELKSVCNQILLGTTVPNYDAVSEQPLRLATPHAFGLVSPASIVASNLGDAAALASLGNNQNRLRGGSSNSKPRLKCDHCNRRGHTVDRCWKLHGRPPRQVNATQIDNPGTMRTSPSLQNPTPSYEDFLRWCQTNQTFGSTASVAHIGSESGTHDWCRM
ncbi:uncharacterized protein LOC127120020 [Lathyrus oleraceus]|uniref:uncharacterized protein LOC127120020 n=1 Tax=Pisum sativum TaxID=3888 RepID=UPI0021D32742|nr:uncharacterized protein LOC127120020 [Pisum sativum]